MNKILPYLDVYKSIFKSFSSIKIKQDDSRSKQFIMRDNLRLTNGWLGYFMILANFAYNPYYWNFNFDNQEEFIKEFPRKISIKISFEIPEGNEQEYKSILFTCLKNAKDYFLKRKSIGFPVNPLRVSQDYMEKLIKDLKNLKYDDLFVLEAIAEKEFNKYEEEKEGIKAKSIESMKEKIRLISDHDYRSPGIYSEEILKLKKEIDKK